MKARDLMIGCLVKTNSNSWYDESLRDKVCKVEHIGQNYLSCSLVEDPERKPYGEDKSFEPIPITAEILKKNGVEQDVVYLFECSNEHFYIGYWETEHVLEVQNHRSKEEITINCDYVHQLQQALRLCGIEKEIII